MKNRIRLIGLFIGVMVVAILPKNACSFDDCSCAFGSQGTPAGGLNKMDAIFIGKAVAIDEAKGAEGFLDISFQAYKYYKGKNDLSVIVRTPKNTKDCNYAFKIDETYLVYAKYKDQILFTDSCSRTRTINEAKTFGDINVLNLLVFGNPDGTKELETDSALLGSLEPCLRDALKVDAAFLGVVIKVEESKDAPEMLEVNLRVVKVFMAGKSFGASIIVLTPKDIKKDGFDFTSSKLDSYIVYANYRNGVLYTDKNFRTETIEKAGPDGDLGILDAAFITGMTAYGRERAEIGPGGKPDQNKLVSADALWAAVKKIVLVYYPAAQFTITKDNFIFEYNTHYVALADVTTVGQGMHGKIVKGPKKDGIFGQISLVYDKYYNHYVNSGWVGYKDEFGKREAPEGKIVITVKEKGSQKYSTYVHLNLVSPLGVKSEIEDPLVSLIDNFESYLGSSK